MRYLIALPVLCFLVAGALLAQQPTVRQRRVPDPVPSATIYCQQTPREMRKNYPNPYGCCVWLSSAMGGIQSNDPKAWCLPYDTVYGKAEFGGADPVMVAHAFAKRGIHAWNVIGKDTIAMARWAVKTGRGCAIGFDAEHFQAVWGYDYDRKVWFIWDNRYPEYISEYTEAEFERMHDLSGRWVVVLERPGDRIPKPVEW